MFAGPLDGSIIQAREERMRLLDLKIHQLRDYTVGVIRRWMTVRSAVDQGMLLEPEPIFEAVEAIARGKRRR